MHGFTQILKIRSACHTWVLEIIQRRLLSDVFDSHGKRHPVIWKLGGFRMNKEIESLKRKEDGLIDEQIDVEEEIIYQVGNIIECNFDSDTIRTRITSHMKSLTKIREEDMIIRDRIDFLNKCEKEGWKK